MTIVVLKAWSFLRTKACTHNFSSCFGCSLLLEIICQSQAGYGRMLGVEVFPYIGYPTSGCCCWAVKVEGCSIVGYFLHVCSAAQRAKLEEINWSISLLWLVVYPVCVQTGRAEQRLQLIFEVQVASS
jgi:hypothetical protein